MQAQKSQNNEKEIVQPKWLLCMGLSVLFSTQNYTLVAHADSRLLGGFHPSLPCVSPGGAIRDDSLEIDH